MFGQSKKPRIHKFLETSFVIDKSVGEEMEADIKDFIHTFATLITSDKCTVYFEYANERQINRRLAKFKKESWEQIYISTHRSKEEANTYSIVVSSNGLLANLNFIAKALMHIVVDLKQDCFRFKDSVFKEKLERLYISAMSIYTIYNTKRVIIDNQYENYDQTIVQVACGLTDVPIERTLDETEKYIAYLMGIGKTTVDIVLTATDRKLMDNFERQLKYLLNQITLGSEITNGDINTYKMARKVLGYKWESGEFEAINIIDDIDIPDIFFNGGDEI